VRREETIRGYSNVGLLVIDEAARVPDDLYRAVRRVYSAQVGRVRYRKLEGKLLL
jgi:hypothetical protein